MALLHKKLKKRVEKESVWGDNFLILFWAIFIDIIGFISGLLGFLIVPIIFSNILSSIAGIPIFVWGYKKYKKRGGFGVWKYIKQIWKTFIAEALTSPGPWLTLFVRKTIRGRKIFRI